ncbi:MAG: alpha/beta hydrolase [Roseiflexaceae bacterium]|nr:alpha/beta hydrolase [Roseiflexaceae bacterium]
MRHQSFSRAVQLGRGIGLLSATSVASLAALALWPIDLAHLTARPNPTHSYDTALARLRAFELPETDGNVAAYGRTRLLAHGQATKRVIVLIHGMTNCPEQYVKLAPQFHAQGYTVLVPRMPLHGLRDRNTSAMGALTAAQLCQYADTAIDIACGLGEHVTVAGISAGGVIAAWLCQQRADVDLAVQIASAFRTHQVPAAINTMAMRLACRLPNMQVPINGGLDHGYTSHSTRGFAEVMKLGQAVRQQSQRHPPAARAALVITNACDNVDNGLTMDLLARWQQHGLQPTAHYEFPRELGFDHDIIDPAQPDQHTDYVYPTLREQIDRMTRSSP